MTGRQQAFGHHPIAQRVGGIEGSGIVGRAVLPVLPKFEHLGTDDVFRYGGVADDAGEKEVAPVIASEAYAGERLSRPARDLESWSLTMPKPEVPIAISDRSTPHGFSTGSQVRAKSIVWNSSFICGEQYSFW